MSYWGKMSMSDDDKSPKKTDVQTLIENAWLLGKVRIDSTNHAGERSAERDIDVMDLREVILYGAREEEMDNWKKERGHWVYALRNRDVDGRDIRVIFDVEGFPDVVVVTVMHVYP